MRLATHLAFGAACHAAATLFADLPLEPAGLALVCACAALPDVDTLGSTVGRALPFVARPIERRFGHRTATHSYAAQGALALVLLPLSKTWPHLYLACVVGYASHPFLDTLTVQGVRLFWPLSDKRCVFPYFARQPLRYRTTTGSRADTLFCVGFALLFVPLATLHAEGYERFVRRLQGDTAAAVRDFLDYSEQGRLVTVTVHAADPQTGRRLEGRFEALGTTAKDVLVVRDTDGRAYALGPHYSAHFQPHRITAQAGAPVSITRRSVDLSGRSLADLATFVPRQADGQTVRHLLAGELRLVDAAHVMPEGAQFETVAAEGQSLRLRYATLADLEKHLLTGHVVASGAVEIRLFLSPGEAERYHLADAGARVRHVSVPFRPDEAPRLLVGVGDTVAAGDTLAVLRAGEIALAAAEAADAAGALGALRALAPHGTDDERRLAAEVERHARETGQLAARKALGYVSPTAVDAAQAAQRDAEGRLASHRHAMEARHAQHTARVAEAEARLRTARFRLYRLQAGSAVRAPATARVAHVETRHPTPDRHELRIRLE